MPCRDDLPGRVKDITNLNALEIRHSRFADDLKHCLSEALQLESKHFSPSGLYEKAKAILVGLVFSAFLLVVVAQLHNWVLGMPLNKTLGNTLTVGLLIIVPVISMSIFWKRWIRK